jgi:hypothetical protein
VGAFDEARRLGHHWIGEEHLLLALSRADDVAGDVLLVGEDVEVEPLLARVLATRHDK